MLLSIGLMVALTVVAALAIAWRLAGHALASLRAKAAALPRPQARLQRGGSEKLRGRRREVGGRVDASPALWLSPLGWSPRRSICATSSPSGIAAASAFPLMVFIVTLASAGVGLWLKSEIKSETLQMAYVYPLMAAYPDAWLYHTILETASQLANAALLTLVLSQAAAMLARSCSGLRGFIKGWKEGSEAELASGLSGP